MNLRKKIIATIAIIAPISLTCSPSTRSTTEEKSTFSSPKTLFRMNVIIAITPTAIVRLLRMVLDHHIFTVSNIMLGAGLSRIIGLLVGNGVGPLGTNLFGSI